MAGNLTAMIAAAFSGGAAPPVTSDPYYEYTTLLLPGNGTNGAQNNTFLDGSTNNFTITRNGNTTQGTFSPFSQTGWGAYFDGSSYLSISTASSTLDLGTGDFTIEMWVNPLTQTTSFPSIICCASAWSPGAFYIRYSNTGAANKFGIYWNGVGDPFFVSSSTYPENTWHHVAVTRSGSTVTLWVNGASAGTGNSSASLNLALGGGVWVGNNASSSCNYKGYISNIRVVKNVAVYTGAFTPPTSPLAATQSAGTNISAITGTQTSLLTCQSNRFIDNSSNAFAITANGNTSVVAFSPFNPSASWSAATYGGSGYFDGSGDYLQLADSTAWDLSGDYTIEMWINVSAISSSPTFFQIGSSSLFWYISSATKYLTTAGSLSMTASTAITLNSWNHIAICRSGSSTNNTKMYLNGVKVAETTNTTSFTGDGSNGLRIGAEYPSNYYLNGYISNLRVVNGTAVYTADFTPPTAPVTAITNTSLLLNFTNAGIYDATSKNDLETVGNAQISTTQSKWGGSSIYLDGTGDYLTSPSNNLVSLGTADFTVEFWVNYASAIAYSTVIISTWFIEFSNTRGLVFYDGATGYTRAYTVATSQWYHVAVSKQGTNLRFFIDGVQQGATVTSYTYNITNASTLEVGRGQGGLYPVNGYIQDLRITKGYARYTANFTPPTAAFPTL